MHDPDVPPALVLLVEDDPLVAVAAEMALLDDGFSVQLAPSGEVEVADLEHIALSIACLVTDIQLGGPITGWDVARRARELRPGVPVIFVSGDSAGAWLTQGVQPSLMLPKPYSLAALSRAIAGLLSPP